MSSLSLPSSSCVMERSKGETSRIRAMMRTQTSRLRTHANAAGVANFIRNYTRCRVSCSYMSTAHPCARRIRESDRQSFMFSKETIRVDSRRDSFVWAPSHQRRKNDSNFVVAQSSRRSNSDDIVDDSGRFDDDNGVLIPQPQRVDQESEVEEQQEEVEGGQDEEEEELILDFETDTETAIDDEEALLNAEALQDVFKNKQDSPGHYEVMYIIHPDEIEDVDNIMQDVVNEMGKEGIVHRLQDMGVRQMAYSMGKGKKKTDLGNYVLMNFECKPQSMKKMSDKMERLQKEQILLRFLFQRLSFAVTKEWEWGQQDWGYVEAEQRHREKAKRRYHIKDNQERMTRLKKRQQRRDNYRMIMEREDKREKETTL